MPPLLITEKSPQSRFNKGKSLLLHEGHWAVPQAQEEKKRVEEWGTGATVRQTKAPKERSVPTAERMPAQAKELLFPGDTARVPTAARSGPCSLSREEARERGGPLTFSSSDTRSSKSAILGCSGPTPPNSHIFNPNEDNKNLFKLFTFIKDGKFKCIRPGQ